MAWNAGLPVEGTSIVNIPSVHSNNWVAIEEAFDQEHHTFNSVQEGHHRQGVVGVISAGPAVGTSLPSPPQSGCWAFDTTTGHTLIFNSYWQYPTVDWLTTKIKLDLNGSDFDPPVTAPKNLVIPSGAAALDQLGEWHSNATSAYFAPKEEGYFFVSATSEFMDDRAALHEHLHIRQYNAASGQINCLSATGYSAGEDVFTVHLDAVLHLDRGDFLHFTNVMNTGLGGFGDSVVSGGPEHSYWIIARVA